MIKNLPTGNIENYTLVLSRPDHTHIGILRYYDEFHVAANLMGGDEISFNAHIPTEAELRAFSKEERDQVLFLWEELTDLKYVYVKELRAYFVIKVELSDTDELVKSVTGTDASAVELSNVNLYDYQINTEADIEREDYITPTIFYNPGNPSASLLHRLLEKVPQWTVKDVDLSLQNIQRKFEFSGDNIWDALTGDIAEEIECIFEFDSVDRTISAYDLQSYCLDCGYRGDFHEVCPKCESDSIMSYGQETTVLIDTENLADEIGFAVDTDAVKNCFKLEAGDDDMTAAIRNINPNGSDYIYYFTDAMKHEMPEELVSKMEEYDALLESYRPEFEQLTQDVYQAIDKIIYYQSKMMPKVDFTNEKASDQLALLTPTIMDEVALSTIGRSTSKATVSTAIKSYVKLIINSGRYKVDTVDDTWTLDADNKAGTWSGKIKLVSWSTANEKKAEDRDEATSGIINVRITTNYDKFIEQKIKAHIKDHDAEDGSVYDVLNIEDLEKFSEALGFYCLNRLTSFADALTGVRDIMIEAGQAVPDAELYESHYIPILDKIEAVQKQMDFTNQAIDDWKKIYETKSNRRNQIQAELNFVEFLGKDLYKTFCVYKREQSYSNKNFISDDLEDDEIFDNAKQFYERANRELKKSAENQHSITGTVHNLMAIPEFKEFIPHFRLGNFIRVRIDGKVYRLRLTSVGLTQSSQENIDVEFSDVLRTGNGFSDIQSILDSAKKVAGTYDATMQQVRKSKEQTDFVKDFVEYGMAATAVKIVNNATRQSFLVDDSGLTMRQKVEYTENEYEPYQAKMIGSGLYLTEDNWRTVSTALGKYITIDPDTGEQVTNYGLLADTIVGRLILGQQLGLYSNDGSAEMSFDDKGLVLNTKDNGTGVYKNIFSIQKDGESLIWVDNQGHLMINDDSVKLAATNETINSQFAQIDNMYVHNETISHLFANSITGKDAVILNLTSQNAVLGDATIAKAIISQLNAGMIDAAYINTDFVQIGNTDKDNFLINGSTMQIVDENQQIRVQIGKDEKTGEYSYWLWNDQGELIWNPEGITYEGVPDLLINNQKVAEGANIHGSKLDIPSVAQKLNEDGSITMDISHVKIDNTTLDVQFAELTTKVTDTENNMKTQGTAIKAVQDSIDQKVWMQDIESETDPIKGDITTINNQYSQINQTINTIDQTIKDINSTFEQNKSEVNDTFNTITDTLDSHTQSIGDFTTKISSIDDDITGMSSKYNEVKDTLDGHTQTIGNVQTSLTNVEASIEQQGQSITDIQGTVLEHKQTLDGFGTTLTTLKEKTEEDIQDLNDALSGKADGEQLKNLEKQVTQISAKQGEITLSVSSVQETVKKTIKDVSYKYMATTNNTLVPDKDDPKWDDQPPVLKDGEYCWSMSVVAFVDDSVEKKTPYCITERGQDSILLRIDSTEGLTFRNGNADTLLNVTIIKGKKLFTTIQEVRAEFGDQAVIDWEEKKESGFVQINPLDNRILNGGMTLQVSSANVNSKAIFNAFLNV